MSESTSFLDCPFTRSSKDGTADRHLEPPQWGRRLFYPLSMHPSVPQGQQCIVRPEAKKPVSIDQGLEESPKALTVWLVWTTACICAYGLAQSLGWRSKMPPVGRFCQAGEHPLSQIGHSEGEIAGGGMISGQTGEVANRLRTAMLNDVVRHFAECARNRVSEVFGEPACPQGTHEPLAKKLVRRIDLIVSRPQPIEFHSSSSVNVTSPTWRTRTIPDSPALASRRAFVFRPQSKLVCDGVFVANRDRARQRLQQTC